MRLQLSVLLLSLLAISCNSDTTNDMGVPPPPPPGPPPPPPPPPGVDMGMQGVDMGVVMDTGTMCIDLTVYQDNDNDGYGTSDMTQMACLVAGEEVAGYSRRPGDCADDDPITFPDSEGICGDFVDDNCDMQDEDCPTTQTAAINAPMWDCTGTPPDNVYGWARFSNGNGYYQDGGCFVFFEGLPNEFYAQHNLQGVNQDASCNSINGCICPSLNNWPSYDRRIYAFTKNPNADPCPENYLVDHAFNEQLIQPISNVCRKYLYQMHFYDIPFNFIASSEEGIQRRLEAFSEVEVACIEDRPHRNLPFQSLMTTTVELNPNFVKQ